MLIEIHGAGFSNKGAQLMLETVVEKVTENIPQARCCIAAGKDRPDNEVGNLGLKYIWPSKILEGRKGKFNPLFKTTNFLSSLVPNRYLEPYGLVKRSQIDALIDISGFAFGDLWGPQPIKIFTYLASFYARRNRPVVMLPQMLGPFETDDNSDHFRKMCSHCSLVFARDDRSFDIASECLNNDPKLRQAPDITLFQKGADTRDRGNDVMLVPNIRVLDKGTDWDEKKYVEMFHSVGTMAKKAGYGIQILIHETFGQDAAIADKIRSSLNLPASSIFADPSPTKLKKKIASGAFLVGSRFHSLAGALSTATPVIAVGWAHKYKELLSDFGVGRFDVSSAAVSDSIPGLVNELLDSEKRDAIIGDLKQAKDRLTGINSAMWNDVFDLLSKRT